MVINVKNMVCDRCIQSVQNVLDQRGLSYVSIDLGSVLLEEVLSKVELEELNSGLKLLGFELLEDEDKKYVELIRNAVIKLIRIQPESLKKYTVSSFIETEVGKDYKWLSTLYSSQKNQTIEQFVIAQKIEKVKELLSYNELSISEISDVLHYSSVAHLSNQFKKITGFTPSKFRMIGGRIALDKI